MYSVRKQKKILKRNNEFVKLLWLKSIKQWSRVIRHTKYPDLARYFIKYDSAHIR